MPKQEMEDLVQPHLDWVQRVCRPVSHQGTQDVGSDGTAEQKSYQRYHRRGRKGVKMAVDQAGGSVGYKLASLINPSWVT